MVNRLRVGLIFGGRSGEHEVSLMSARSVLSAIDQDKYEITQIGISHEGGWLVGENVLDELETGHFTSSTSAALWPDPGHKGIYAIQSSPAGDLLNHISELDVVFPVLHGTFGEDGTLQGLLELADLAYVGAGVLGSSLGMDKAVFKSVMRAHGIPVVDWIVVTRSEIQQDVRAVIDQVHRLGDYPLFIKPANLGSSVGITRCTSTSDVLEGLYEAVRFDRRVLVERGIRNPREIEVSVLGNQSPVASVPGEVLPSRNFYSYESKYIDGTSQLLIPAPLSTELTGRIQTLAIQAYQAIDCAGMARVDFLLAAEAANSEDLFLGELNTIPGFTQISMYPKLWEHSGLSYPALIDRLIELALERKIERDRTERRFHRESS